MLSVRHGPAKSRSGKSVLAYIWPFTICVILIALPLCVWEMDREEYDREVIAWFVAGVFSLLAVPLAVQEIFQHAVHYYQPYLQKHVIRIIWMVPFYAVDCWLSLRYKEAALFLDVARECYEAVVIYSFVKFLMLYLSGEDGNEEELAHKLAHKQLPKHMFPLCWMRHWQMPSEFVVKCKLGILQYLILRPLTAISTFLLEWQNLYDNGNFSPDKGYVYITIINNCSQMWALYILVLFYHAASDLLAPVRPFLKFCCVKGVVFFTWWQGVAIAIFIRVHLIKKPDHWNTDDLAASIQNFLICIEMFIAALAHRYAFSYKDYCQSSDEDLENVSANSETGRPEPPLSGTGTGRARVSLQQQSLLRNMMDSFNIQDDVRSDVKDVMKKKQAGLDNLLIQHSLHLHTAHLHHQHSYTSARTLDTPIHHPLTISHTHNPHNSHMHGHSSHPSDHAHSSGQPPINAQYHHLKSDSSED
eukprot:TRINITY_DN4239_c0_g1::TRINITY_DN4239_c0_g1_i1::g.7929::m.7929 TRINITY_DN4239_c0_g1::TRINITY_DN4239_c0_g1_i1::g.7929  ORF type:complete len:473 (+),score=22.49,sp/Q5RET6/T184C_PONAB/46.18/2e-90,Solute_trans_a/PF03619.11/5.4e-97,Nramp/PF01566.13/0.0028,Branch_AA_trans/PF05525.8/0.23 TRINITY_DN4239_c0_g1_i1:320-1738(+)